MACRTHGLLSGVLHFIVDQLSDHALAVSATLTTSVCIIHRRLDGDGRSSSDASHPQIEVRLVSCVVSQIRMHA